MIVFFSQDEDSGDSDNEAEEQRKVCRIPSDTVQYT